MQNQTEEKKKRQRIKDDFRLSVLSQGREKGSDPVGKKKKKMDVTLALLLIKRKWLHLLLEGEVESNTGDRPGPCRKKEKNRVSREKDSILGPLCKKRSSSPNCRGKKR